MTFDEALVTYQDSRTKTREALSEVHRLENQYLELGKELAQSKRRYNVVRRNLQRAQDALIPELRKEVASHQLLDPIEKPEELPATEAETVALVEEGEPKPEITSTVEGIPAAIATGVSEAKTESEEKNADGQIQVV
jgi:DNA gyrase/topoisomerase IV subunit A